MARAATRSLCRTRLCPASHLATQPSGRSPMTSATHGSMGASIFDSTKWQAVGWDGRSGPRFTGTTCAVCTNPSNWGAGRTRGIARFPGWLHQLLGQTDAPHQVYKTGIVADRIKDWVHFEELQKIRLLLVGFLEPEKCPVVFT